MVAAPERDILNCLERHYNRHGSVDESIDQILDTQDAYPDVLFLSFSLGVFVRNAPGRYVPRVVIVELGHHFVHEAVEFECAGRCEGLWPVFVTQRVPVVPRFMTPTPTERKFLA